VCKHCVITVIIITIIIIINGCLVHNSARQMSRGLDENWILFYGNPVVERCSRFPWNRFRLRPGIQKRFIIMWCIMPSGNIRTIHIYIYCNNITTRRTDHLHSEIVFFFLPSFVTLEKSPITRRRVLCTLDKIASIWYWI
jgi:hypothetical protein